MPILMISYSAFELFLAKVVNPHLEFDFASIEEESFSVEGHWNSLIIDRYIEGHLSININKLCMRCDFDDL